MKTKKKTKRKAMSKTFKAAYGAFNPSKYQANIFAFIQDSPRNGVIEAVAGSGKTTTILHALHYVPKTASVLFVAFNRHIAQEMQRRIPDTLNVEAKTLNSVGHRAIMQDNRGKTSLTSDKVFQIIKRFAFAETAGGNFAAITRLTALAKANLLGPKSIGKTFDRLIDQYSLDIRWDQRKTVIDRARDALASTLKERSRIDFDDQIYHTVHFNLPVQEYDFVFVDEAQDLTKAQAVLCQRLAGKNGRVIAVGDSRQAVYAFRGADHNAIPNLVSALKAETLPLSICYRCSSEIVDLARTIVPQIEAAPGAPMGVVRSCSLPDLYRDVQPGDMIVCRTCAPTVKVCMQLIRNGIKAVVLGRDIGKGLRILVKRVIKDFGCDNVHDFLACLHTGYAEPEMAKLREAGKDSQAIALQDRVDTVSALTHCVATIESLYAKIDEVFSDQRAAVTLSTIHRTKGLEAERVFVLRPDLLPHPLAKSAADRMQEANLKYVAITRAKNELVWVQGGE